MGATAQGGRGLVALGDSITRARGGTHARGVHFQSWAQWLAEAMELPFTNLAADGARSADVLADQVPRVGDGHDLGCLYVGVNDARSLDFDEAAFARDAEAIVAALRARCARVLVLTLPEDLGRPTCAPKPARANARLRALAERQGAVLADLARFGGPALVLPDAVHPTAAGEVAIADVAARALGAPVLPSSIAPGPVGGAKAAARYAAWWSRLWVRDVRRRRRERSAT